MYNFLGIYENIEKSLLTFDQNNFHTSKRPFFHTVHPSRNHVNTRPDSGMTIFFSLPLSPNKPFPFLTGESVKSMDSPQEKGCKLISYSINGMLWTKFEYNKGQ